MAFAYEGVMYLVFLPKDQTVNIKFYHQVNRHLCDTIRKISPRIIVRIQGTCMSIMHLHTSHYGLKISHGPRIAEEHGRTRLKELKVLPKCICRIGKTLTKEMNNYKFDEKNEIWAELIIWAHLVYATACIIFINGFVYISFQSFMQMVVT